LKRKSLQQKRNACHWRRGGFTVTELAVASALLGATMVLAVQTLQLAIRQQSATRTQRAVSLEVANAMERMMALPYDELTPAVNQEIDLASRIQRLPQGATLQIEVTPLADERAKRVVVTVNWGEHSGRVRTPRSLCAYRYGPPEEQE